MQEADIPVFIPIATRPSLEDVLKAFPRATTIVGKKPLTQVAALASNVPAEFIAIMDDDAAAPADWFEKAQDAMSDPAVGYVAGPLVDPDSESPAQMVQSSYLGSFLLRDRYRVGDGGDAEDRTPGMGVYRRVPFIQAMKELGEASFSGQDIKLVTWLKAHGWKAVYLPGMASAHPARPTLSAFFMQKYKDGKGRMIYLRRFPRQALTKPWFLLPLVFCLLVLWWPWGEVGLTAYIILIILTTRRPDTVPWFMVNHLGYALGLLRGLRD